MREPASKNKEGVPEKQHTRLTGLLAHANVSVHTLTQTFLHKHKHTHEHAHIPIHTHNSMPPNVYLRIIN